LCRTGGDAGGGGGDGGRGEGADVGGTDTCSTDDSNSDGRQCVCVDASGGIINAHVKRCTGAYHAFFVSSSVGCQQAARPSSAGNEEPAGGRVYVRVGADDRRPDGTTAGTARGASASIFIGGGRGGGRGACGGGRGACGDTDRRAPHAAVGEPAAAAAPVRFRL